MNYLDFFEKKYSKIPSSVEFTPYRICPLGAHVDHQLASITGFALDKGIYISYAPNEKGDVHISSLQFDGDAKWNIYDVPPKPVGDWADHLRGATIALYSRYKISKGIDALIDGELPIGGLSSSAAVIITFLSALSKINNILLSENEIINLALEAENKYVGVSCGKLDQCCEVYCKKNSLLYMDLKTDKYENISAPSELKPYKIAIFFSGVRRSLAGTKYNQRVDEAKSAARILLSMSGVEVDGKSDVYLSDVTRDVFDKYGMCLSENLKKRAMHYFYECDRVSQGVQAWRNGDIKSFGKLVFESGKSSIELWETGSPELKMLYEIMTKTNGIYGGRFSGAGFKGCCMAIIDPDCQDEIVSKVKREYCRAFPELANDFSVHICETADGVQINL